MCSIHVNGKTVKGNNTAAQIQYTIDLPMALYSHAKLHAMGAVLVRSIG